VRALCCPARVDAALALPGGLVRFSVGLEAVADLQTDLARLAGLNEAPDGNALLWGYLFTRNEAVATPSAL
jgi:hypothetical protein